MIQVKLWKGPMVCRPLYDLKLSISSFTMEPLLCGGSGVVVDVVDACDDCVLWLLLLLSSSSSVCDGGGGEDDIVWYGVLLYGWDVCVEVEWNGYWIDLGVLYVCSSFATKRFCFWLAPKCCSRNWRNVKWSSTIWWKTKTLGSLKFLHGRGFQNDQNEYNQ